MKLLKTLSVTLLLLAPAAFANNNQICSNGAKPILLNNPTKNGPKCTEAGGTIATSGKDTYCCIKLQEFQAACTAHKGSFFNNPNQCEGFAGNPNLTVVMFPDGNSDNSKCCVKCKGRYSPAANANECKQGSTFVEGKGCCYVRDTATGTVTTEQAVITRKYCAPPMVFVTTAPVPTTPDACKLAGYTWGLNACCKNP